MATALIGAAVLGFVPPVVGRAVPHTEVSFRNLALSGLVPAGGGAVRGPAGSVHLAREAWSRPGVACAESDFTMVGLTWRQDGTGEVKADLAWADTAAAVDGTGTVKEPMALLHADPLDGPDPGSPDDSGIQGTSPVWTNRARCIGFRLKLPAGETLSRLRAVFVDSSDDEGNSGSGLTAALTRAWQAVSGVWGFLAPRPAAAMATRPDIITRAEWGADESLRRCGPYYADRLKAAYVHHTAGTNTYSRDQADNVVRGILAFHVLGRGWCDIAYNFLVDRFGRIFEGRYGGMSKPLIGGHAAGFNTGTTGVAAMGDFTSTEPSRDMVQAFKRLLAWRLDVAHLRPIGWTKLTSSGGGTSRYGAGDIVTLRVITGHRDTSYTACPGTRLYAKLDSIRRGAEALGLPKLYNPRQSRTALEPGASSISYRATLSGELDWFVDIIDGDGHRVRRLTGRGDHLDAVWDGRAEDGSGVSPGFYRVKLWARVGPDGPNARAGWFDAVACSGIGSKGDDVLDGTPGDDILCGVGGNDVLRGGAGDDLLIGGSGTDISDHSTAGSGVSVDIAAGVSTGQGTDTLMSVEGAIGSAGADVLAGDEGNNRLTGGGGNDRLIGRGGNDTLNGEEGGDTADYSGSDSRVLVDLENGTASGEGSDTLRSVEHVVGSAYADTLLGDAGANTLDGLRGADTIRGREGNDTLRGGRGADLVTGGQGDDALFGGDGVDTITGSAGVDQLAGDRGDDALYARDGEADIVDGGEGTDGARADADLDTLTSVEGSI
ncbi:MAG TPA: N-acetylmuramoyl-L-alanine amidase [Actinomycetota bacterium]|nr:N-acetylmuramoyl-L-alanine amidase [Actinomycetota bacterium]